jgi:hypothetical protein
MSRSLANQADVRRTFLKLFDDLVLMFRNHPLLTGDAFSGVFILAHGRRLNKRYPQELLEYEASSCFIASWLIFSLPCRISSCFKFLR